MANYIGIDIGGSHVRLVCSDSLENPELKDKTVFPTLVDFESDLSRITEYIDTKPSVKGIGISIPGRLNDEKTFILEATHNQNYANRPLSEILSDKYNCLVRMENDAVAASLGEAYLGNVNSTDFIYIIWGTGVGGAYVQFKSEIPISNKIDRAPFLRYWEDLFGGRRLEERYGDSPERFSEADWGKIFTDMEEAILASEEYLKSNKIIFGGGISIKQKDRLQNMASKFSANYPNFPKIEISALGENAGLFGAIELLR